MLAIANVIVGAALLVSGRKLFWLFVAAGGFVAGILYSSRFTQGPEWVTLLIGLAAGLAFAVLAIFLRAFAIGLAGFFLGGSILSAFAGALGMANGRLDWVIFVVGGAIGIFLVSILFDWALIGLSAFSGAALLLQALNLEGRGGGLAFMVLLIVGIGIQAATLQREKKGKDD